MTPEQIFALSGPVALSGWVALALAPLAPRGSQVVAGLVVPLLLAVAYTGLILGHWAGAEGGFGSLAEVAKLFANPWLLLAGWLHYLCFDLFVGAWIVRRALNEKVAHGFVLPCLALTFLFGPVGYLAFNALRLVQRQRKG